MHNNCNPPAKRILKYLCTKIVTYRVNNMEVRSNITGSAFTNPPVSKFDKKTDGFCMTITLDAARRVDRVMHNTNLVGRKRIVGNPITIANIANTPDARNK